MSKKKIEKIQKKNAYSGLLWLFALGSLLGVVLEGIFCLVRWSCQREQKIFRRESGSFLPLPAQFLDAFMVDKILYFFYN